MKKGLAVLLALALVLGTMSGMAFAEESGFGMPEPFEGEMKAALMTASAEEEPEGLRSWADLADTTWYDTADENDTKFVIDTAEELAGLAKLVNEGIDSFVGDTIILGADIDLGGKVNSNGEPLSFMPIGGAHYGTDGYYFGGTFDGNEKTIKNMYQNGWDLGFSYGQVAGMGLFGWVGESTIKNLTIDGSEISMEAVVMGNIAGYAGGACTFENITIKNSKIANYNWDTGGIVGQAYSAPVGEEQIYKNIEIDESNLIAGHWGTWDVSAGGVIGRTADNTYVTLEKCKIAAVLDVFNDVCAAYQWGAYRYSGMLVGYTKTTSTDANGKTTATSDHVTCIDCEVIYGDWANYTYCQPSNVAPQYVRVQEGYSTDAYYSGRHWTAGVDANGNKIVNDNHVHAEGEAHNEMIPFDQLFGGGQGVYGTESKEGVTVKYNNVTAFLTSNGETINYYSLQSAVDAAELGDIIDLNRDVEENIVIGDENAIALMSNDKITIRLNGYKIIAADTTKPVLTSAKAVAISGGEIEGNIVSTASNLSIDEVEHTGTIEATNANITITSGTFSDSSAAAFVADGYQLVRTAYGYTVVEKELQADSISVIYKDITEAGTEGEKTYAIVLKANDNDMINDLASADLTFVYTTTPVTGGYIDFTVAPAEKFTMSRVDKTNRYMFNYDGVGAWEGKANEITIGTIKVVGYGKFTIATANDDAAKATNIVNATTVNDNLVDSYTVAGATDNDDTTGALDISGKVDNGEIKVPTRKLTINVTFPNAVEKNAADYQDMKIEITGNIGGVNKTVKYDLGNNMTDGKYVVTNEDLVLNNAYTVTISGAGYRTARYTVTMTEPKTLNFWNNVMDEEKKVEVGKANSAVVKNFLAGDIVKDNNINIYDLSAVVSYFASESTIANGYAKYDLNRDGMIDSKDVAYVLVSWNN